MTSVGLIRSFATTRRNSLKSIRIAQYPKNETRSSDLAIRCLICKTRSDFDTSRNPYLSFVRWNSTSTHQDRQSILDISPFTLGAETEPSRNASLQTSMLINHFFESLINNDFNRSRMLLIRLSNMINLKYYKASDSQSTISQIDNYFSCFLLLLTSQKMSVQNLKLLIDDFQDVNQKLTKIKTPKSSEIKKTETEIRLKIVARLVECYQSFEDKKRANERIMKRSIAKYTKKVMKDLKLDQKKVFEANSSAGINLEGFLEICRINKTAVNSEDKSAILTIDPSSDHIDEQALSIEPFKDSNGFINLLNLCSYISSKRFSKYGNGKLYTLFDGLEEREKDRFMDEYQHFNVVKQENVEANCLDLIEDFDLEVKENDSALLNKFKNDHSPMLYEWFSINVSHLNALSKKLHKSTVNLRDLDEDELILSQYLIHWNLIPKKALVTLIISNLISMTISSPKEQVRLLDLVKQISASFKRLLYKEKSYRSIREVLLKRFDDEQDGLRLFTSLVRIVIKNCNVEVSNQDLAVLEDSLNLEGLDAFEINHDSSSSRSILPAFSYSLISHDTTKLVGVVGVHPYLYQKFKSYDSLSFNKSLYLPMLCEPKPWTSPTNGGYLKDLKPIITTNDTQTGLVYLNKAHKTGQLTSIYQGLNNLNQTAWAINSKVLNVFNEVMEYDQGFLKIPPKLKVLSPDLDNYHDLKGLRIQYNTVQYIANAFDINGDMFYLPHNVDFRGRAYPMVSELSHYQQDSIRSFMMFWKSQPLGPTGFNWLKYQLVGVYGKDKLNMSQRLEFVDHSMDLILDSAENPIGGKQWWKSGEKPWQTLALCIEISEILKFKGSGGNIENYRSRIPVHQDGSCNGLQHYAALGSDKEGGLSVNLLPMENDQRGDVYSKVLDIVREKVEKDMKDPQNSNLSNLSHSILSRKLIKQTIMTTVYGVTRYGGAAQIEQRIKDIIEDNEIRGVTLTQLKEEKRKIALYLSGLVLNSISELFSGAKLIQDWLLMNCSRVISSFDVETMEYVSQLESKDNVSTSNKPRFNFFRPALFKPMMWTSLSGFPVVQLYKHTKSTLIPTSLQSIKINKPAKIAPINRRKQLNAIAPNFIHSIDSIHMFMTSIAAKLNGIAFVSVHDSFWTYPSDVDKLSIVLREEFVRLHSSEIIENLKSDMEYTTSKSFQLVWIKNSQNDDLVAKIRHTRNKYWSHDTKQRTLEDYNRVLSHELRVQSEEGPSEILKLIQEYNPKLYIKIKNSGKQLELYTESISDTKKSPQILNMSKFTPVLTPVKILNCPPTGELDIREVMNSKYFFS